MAPFRYDSGWIERNPHTQRITIVSLAFCFGMAYVAEAYFGIADITGAYIAGIVLCTMDDAPPMWSAGWISATISSLHPSSLPPSVLKTDISGLTPEILLFCVCFVIVALITKIIGCGLAAKICRFNWGDSLKVGVGMMTRGEVALIVAQKGLAVGVVDPVYFTAVILLIVVSSVATPLALKATVHQARRRVPHPSQIHGIKTLKKIPLADRPEGFFSVSELTVSCRTLSGRPGRPRRSPGAAGPAPPEPLPL